MNQTKILLIVFALIGSAAAWLLIDRGDKTSTVLTEERDFRIEDTDQIHRIFIADRKGNTADMVRQEDHWTYNEKYIASDNVIDNMLEVFRLVEILYIPPEAAVETMVTELATNGIKVEAYDKSGKKLKGYYIGGSTPDERGTFLILENSETPFITTIPHTSGTYWIRFLPQGDKWRDRTIFDYQPEEIKSVSVEYPKQRDKSFILNSTDEGFTVKPYYDVVTPVSGNPSSGVVERFLTKFEDRRGENYINDSPSLQIVQDKIPFVSISVTSIDGDTKQIQLWPMDNIDNAGRLKSEETERYYCLDSQGDFLLIQHRVFEEIFWAYESFFQ